MVSIHGSVGGIRVAERHRGNTFGEHFVCKCRISYEERTESSAEMFFSVFLKMWIIVTIEQGAEALGDGKVLRSRHAGRATASVQIGAEPSLGGREHGQRCGAFAEEAKIGVNPHELMFDGDLQRLDARRAQDLRFIEPDSV